MSEEKKEEPKEKVEEKPAEAIISFTNNSSRIEIAFADGVHEIPANIVEYLGMETLETLAPGLATKTFGEFKSGFMLKMQKDSLTDFGRQFRANHFGKIQF